MFALIRNCETVARRGTRSFLLTPSRQFKKKPKQHPWNSSSGSKPGPKSFNSGQMALAGGSVLGLGAIAYYGLDNRSMVGLVWPNHVKQRMRDTYFYVGTSLGLTAGMASQVLRNPVFMGLARGSQSTGMFIGCIAGLMFLNNQIRSFPYTPGSFGPKHLAWVGYCAVVAVLSAPISALGGPLLIRAAVNSGAMLGGLTLVSFCSPSEQFQKWGGPLSMAFALMLCASIFPGTTTMALKEVMFTYGALALFGAFILYNNSKIIQAAEKHPSHPGAPLFDPISASVGLFIHTVNAFAAMAMILAKLG